MEKEIYIKFWGVRGSTPCPNIDYMSYGGNTTCFQIFSPDVEGMLVIDCGTGFRNLGNQLQISCNPVKGQIFITHPHWDHLQGFPFFKPFYSSKNKFDVFIPPQNNMRCKDILQGHMSSTFFPVSMDMLEADINCETFIEKSKDFGPFQVEYIWARHTVDTAIFKFHFGDKVIIFAPDNEIPISNSAQDIEFIKTFSDFVRNADILVHDAQFTPEQHKLRVGWGHSNWDSVLDLTKDLNIKKVFLTHHDPDHNDSLLDEINIDVKNRFGKHFEALDFIKEGQVISLPL